MIIEPFDPATAASALPAGTVEAAKPRRLLPAVLAGGISGLVAGALVVGVAFSLWSPRNAAVPIPVAATAAQSASAASGAPTNVRGIVEKAEPAVVSITDNIGAGVFGG